MRRPLLLAIAFGMVSLGQVSGLNLIGQDFTFNAPLTILLMLLPWLGPRTVVAVTVGAALPLDYTSALPFGCYLLSFSLTVFLARLLIRRLPITTSRALHLALIGLGSLITFASLWLTSGLVVAVRLGSWTYALDPTVLFRSLAAITAINLLSAAVLFGLTGLVQTFFRRRFLLPHAAP